MEEFKVSFADKEKVEKKSLRQFWSYFRFETINVELFVCTVLASLFESSAEKQLSLTFHGVVFLLLSLTANILLIELIFRFMKVVKNGKIRKSGRDS